MGWKSYAPVIGSNRRKRNNGELASDGRSPSTNTNPAMLRRHKEPAGRGGYNLVTSLKPWLIEV
jgi:hypothetical protein